MAILAFLRSPIAHYLALAALVVAIWGYGFSCGVHHVEQRDQKLAARTEAARDAEVARLAKVRERISYQYIPQVREIEAKARTIIQEVPKYVTVESDRACVVPVGFRVLHDAAARNALPETGSGPNDAASGITLSTVGATVAGNYATCNAVRLQLTKLQEWVRETSSGASE